MNETKIKTILTKLINKIILPQYPFLSIRSIKSPSENMVGMIRLSDGFDVFLNSSEILTPNDYQKISSDINSLFRGASLNSYKEKNRGHYFVVTFIKIIPTGELMSANSLLP